MYNKTNIKTNNKNTNQDSNIYNHVITDINEIIQSKKVLSTYYHKNNSDLYVLLSDYVQIYSISQNIQKTYTISLPLPILKGSLKKSNKLSVYLITQTNIYQLIYNKQINQKPKLYKLFQINKTDIQSTLLNDHYFYITTGNSLVKYDLEDSKNIYSISFNHLQFSQSRNSIVINRNQEFIMLSTNKQEIIIVYEPKFNKNQLQNISKTTGQQISYFQLGLGKNCKRIKLLDNYTIITCSNKLILIHRILINRCYTQSNTQNCLNNIKYNNVNVGYLIKDVELYNNHTLLVRGYNQFGLFHLCQGLKPQIIQIKRGLHYNMKTKLENVYLLGQAKALVVTESHIQLAQYLPEKFAISCQTADDYSESSIPSGKYKGTILVQSICDSNKNTQDYQHYLHGNLCQILINLNLNIIDKKQDYQFIWYILIGIILFLLLVNLVYFIVKKRQLKHKYMKFEDEKGAQIVQQSFVTENDDSPVKNKKKTIDQFIKD